ncbi:MAG: 50S ribosomal protein L1 [Pelagibacterales bacterium]|nr:50S ribosomal protein L1 [Pelagibacterales bacterium]
MKRSNRYIENLNTIDRDKEYLLSDAVGMIKDLKSVKFDETIDLAVNLGVDPKHADQIVRGTISLPHGTGKKVTVLVLCKGDNVVAAEEAGADFVGADDMIEKIKGGWLDIDVIIATPDMMASVGKIGRVLGPRGLMPNPKSGTVTKDVAKAVSEVKAGRIEFRVDKFGLIHVGVGKLSFDNEKLIDNVNTFMGALLRARPSASKGTYLKKVTIASTMGVGLKIDKNEFTA